MSIIYWLIHLGEHICHWKSISCYILKIVFCCIRVFFRTLFNLPILVTSGRNLTADWPSSFIQLKRISIILTEYITVKPRIVELLYPPSNFERGNYIVAELQRGINCTCRCKLLNNLGFSPNRTKKLTIE